METDLYEIAWIAGISVVSMAVVFRTPLAGYVTGQSKIMGVI